MAKIYTKKTAVAATLKPRKETIDFILNYSKALNVIATKNQKIEIIAN